MIDYTLTRHCLHLVDSYRVPRWRMRSELKEIRATASPTLPSLVWKRSIFSLKMEWLCHNTLYRLGIQRDRTKDADLDYPCDRPEWQYIVCGLGVTAVELAALAGIVWAIVSLIR